MRLLSRRYNMTRQLSRRSRSRVGNRQPASRRRDTPDPVGYTEYKEAIRIAFIGAGAHAGIVSVSYAANGAVVLEAVSNGFHILTETPIAHELSQADEIIRVAHGTIITPPA